MRIGAVGEPDTRPSTPMIPSDSFLTLEGFWSLLRSWLRPHRGISQGRLPLYLGFFEFVHNVRRRGQALSGSSIGLIVAPRNPGGALSKYKRGWDGRRGRPGQLVVRAARGMSRSGCTRKVTIL